MLCIAKRSSSIGKLNFVIILSSVVEEATQSPSLDTKAPSELRLVISTPSNQIGCSSPWVKMKVGLGKEIIQFCFKRSEEYTHIAKTAYFSTSRAASTSNLKNLTLVCGLDNASHVDAIIWQARQT